MNVLLLGSGGREHAMAWKIAQSARCHQLYIAPGNAGTSSSGINVNIEPGNFKAIHAFVEEKKIQIVIVGPEQPLVDGIGDYFETTPGLENVALIGPGKAAAALEGSKDFAKSFMSRHNIPTAAYKTFDKETLDEGLAYIKSGNKERYVLKADGLAAGKGVIITETQQEALAVLKHMIANNQFGKASERVVIEDFLEGIELSVFVLTDGEGYVILPEAKDYKRIGEGDTGLNTGGMGSVSPVPFVDKAFMKKVDEQIIAPTIKGLKKDNIPYKGFIFFGLMNVKGDPYVIEYNVRMGDPETESVIPRIKTDILTLFEATANGTLSTTPIEIDPRYATTVMLVSGGYPEAYSKGKTISGLEKLQDSLIFHAGTKTEDLNIVTNGGRVIAVTALADTMEEALTLAYQKAESITFEGCYYRHDLGQDLLR